MRAILAVYDKRDIVDFARGLHDMGWELVGTGGTARTIAEAGLPITEVADLTGSPEMLGGRVKTLHPAVHGGILYRRGHAGDEAEVALYEVPAIDLVAGNLYPFIETVTGRTVDLAEALEQIDIGGPTMIRAAAKNHPWVLPVVSPDDYPTVLEALRAAGGPEGVPLDLRRRLAAKAFQHVAHYDTAVAEYLREDDDPFPAQFTTAATLIQQNRYGENPHQRGAFYRADSVHAPAEGIGGFRQHHGKAMSYVNFLDADAAYNLAADFETPAVAIIKHTNPACFATSADSSTVSALYERALAEGDFVSAYGGIVATNRVVDMAFATALRDVRSPGSDTRMFYEIVIAPGYEPDALEHLKKKSKDLRILTAPLGDPHRPHLEVRSVRGGLLVQDSDVSIDTRFDLVSDRPLTPAEDRDLRVGWIVSKHVKSNAVVFVKDGVMIGMGAGQPNRVGSARLCAEQAGERARGAVAATDALIPFPDTVEVCAAAGCTVVAHTGGSIRDDESIAAANRLNVSLVTTGVRHFRH
ncbi:MAG: bifunctional phosphoribosylaminoimidazolecarboxamide formyltransferase/IMP cyclohydrolase PurH [Chloroflexi bacterium]|nr:bifunctional phosphoribosylaminoimidazolecarboxamide formyltransferase/IMP cyclohydrolase [Chloroflexota bacterium]MDA1146954.1 bifunctional phosphoribosylaminoimidazolecarboxamide formyltransferase/IMP cyclohydrolase [Chloroflexota bacterium]MQC82350.1 bifunctional phosphoribosylaminoimidazolecarboxamide formyltransferase/IMP cyclohydrolase PurH [Chloroflexota bacterium]MQC83008.1 bifunctional phosphoribosylaminoimidazolecarboxamide formyltransferase/IMP cyclohydrolase PurH [Chloroflexota ba